jgi:tungstate transport system ATP-binding protein
MTQPAYHIKGLEHRYNHLPVLSIDDLRIKPATITGFIGPNGSGKSSLLKLLAFVEKPARGRILFKGSPLLPFSEVVQSERITMLSQEPYLLKRSVADNVSYGLKVRGDTARLSERIEEAMQWVGLAAGDFRKRRWYELSGGETQRVALAARLVLKPEALLMDEPTANVDAASAQLIKDASIKAREEWGTTLIVASHDLQWLYGICDEALHFFQGRILDSKMGNIIFGPWEQFEDKSWGKALKGGQRIITSSPPDKTSVAMIKPSFFPTSIEDNRAVPTRKILHGVIARMILEQSTQEVIVTVPVGNYPFTLKLTQKQIQDMDIYPGCNVAIGYDPDAVEWY